VHGLALHITIILDGVEIGAFIHISVISQLDLFVSI